MPLLQNSQKNGWGQSKIVNVEILLDLSISQTQLAEV
jgi:hypothetical protein